MSIGISAYLENICEVIMFWNLVPSDTTYKVIIYGAGSDGIATLITLLNEGIYVTAFCDSNPQKQVVRIMNKRVISPKELFEYENKDSVRVFIGSNKYKEEIRKSLQEAGFMNIYENRGEYNRKITVGKPYRFGSGSWYSIIEQSYRKTIYVFGSSEIDLEFAEKLQMVDIQVAGIITNNDNPKNELGIPEINISDIKACDRNQIMIYIMSEIPAKVRILEAIGLKNGYHYRVAAYIYGGYRVHNPYVRLDVNCGFTYVDHESAPGYNIIGDEDYQYKIMVLGASATDHYYHYYPSWVQFFYEYMKERGYKTKIYNGAMQAYSEQQNLSKLIRDIPIICPDMVVYFGGGINAMNIAQEERLYCQKQPFANKYFTDILINTKPVRKGYVNDALIKELFGTEEEQSICIGLTFEDEKDLIARAVENFLYAVRCMNAVCSMQHAEFLNFLDPLLLYTETIGIMDREKLYHDENFFSIIRFRNDVCRFREMAVRKMDPYYQVDLTQVLNRDGMYDDIWHPNEEGNKILARYVFDKVVARFKKFDNY